MSQIRTNGYFQLWYCSHAKPESNRKNNLHHAYKYFHSDKKDEQSIYSYKHKQSSDLIWKLKQECFWFINSKQKKARDLKTSAQQLIEPNKYSDGETLKATKGYFHNSKKKPFYWILFREESTTSQISSSKFLVLQFDKACVYKNQTAHSRVSRWMERPNLGCQFMHNNQTSNKKSPFHSDSPLSITLK